MNSPAYNVAHVSVWLNLANEYVVGLRGVDGRIIVDDTGEKEQAEYRRKGDALKQAKMLSKHYGVEVVIDRTAGGKR